jgi:YidC/Oxa1 family membrane protein insertase
VIPALVFSILSPLEDAVRWLLFRFHDNIGLSWAWSIVATTVVVRIVLVPLTVRQIHSMQSLQKHAPEMKEIQRKYKGDREKLNQELMKFYRENHINPAASCLPLIAQLPVFFALYLVLRHFGRYVQPGSDLSWLHFVPSISAKANSHWSGYVLLAVYAGSQILSSYFMSTTMDKAQRVILMVFPVLFITVVAHFPTGLVLYWVTTNLWTVGQGLITRRLMPKTPLPTFSPKRTSRTPASAPVPAPASKPAAVSDGGSKPATPKQRPQARQAPRRVKRKKGGRR